MATGILGRSSPSATTNTTVYTVPSGKVASFTISCCNTNESAYASLRIALATSGTPSAGDYIEYGASVGPGQVLERSGIVANADTLVVAYSTVANVNIVVYGFEE